MKQGPRAGACSVTLKDGKVLVIGGGNDASVLSTVERFDPVTRTWGSPAALGAGVGTNMCVRLPDGRVLIAGGFAPTPVAIVQIYDPVADKWSAAASLPEPRADGGIVLLPSGKVLVAGGLGGKDVGLTSSVIYDPAANAWRAGPAMRGAHVYGTTLALPDHRLLIFGGRPDGNAAELYDSVTNRWKAIAPLVVGRDYGTRAVHIGGVSSGGLGVMVAGGWGGSSLAATEIYDSAKDTWSLMAPMKVGRDSHALVPLPGGLTLSAGGTGAAPSSAEVYDASKNEWSLVGSMSMARAGAVVHAIGAGVLVAGGLDPAKPSSTAEIYEVCSSGFSADGVCCDRRCDEPCEACDLPGSVGTCKAVASGKPRTGRSCGAFAACNAGACITKCAGDADCAPGMFCSSQNCVEKRGDGQSCAAAGECFSGQCVDSVCCNEACSGQCQACDVPGSLGTCTAVKGAAHGTRTPCGAVLSECGSTCDGSDVAGCHPAPDGARCGANQCIDARETHESTCNGAGACRDVARDCRPFGCDGVACRTFCSSAAECSAGFLCDGGRCVPSQDGSASLYGCGARARRSAEAESAPWVVLGLLLGAAYRGRRSRR